MRARIFTGLSLILFSLAVFLAGCSTPQPPPEVFRPDKLAEMDVDIESAIASNKCPGGVHVA
ncbi:MAG: hypothetical protein WDN00_17350 [Limisphaerales bacterium]